MLKKAMLLLAVSTSALAGPHGGSEASSASANLSSEGMGQIVQGSSKILAAGSQLPIVAIKTVGDFSYITLKTLHGSATTTIRVSRDVAGHVLMSTGQLIQVVATGTGQMLYTSGHMIAYIPNQAGKELLHNEKV